MRRAARPSLLLRSYRFENGALLQSGDAGKGSERLRFTITWVRAE